MAVNLIQSKEHLSPEGLRKIIVIKASMNRGLSYELQSAFREILPVETPSQGELHIKDPL